MPNPLLPDISQVTIIGPGLLGASVGLGLRQAGFAGRIVGVARRQATLDAARHVGAIDDGFTKLSVAIARDGGGVVVVAVPIGKFDQVFRELAAHQRPGLCITDVGSTKRGVCDQAKQLLKQSSHFVPAHPMAGSEKQGPEHADGGLFRGRPCVLCPDEETDAGALATVTAMWGALGAVMHTMSAQEHDQQVAAISHLPHLLSVLLTQTAAGLGPLDLASSGFCDTTRLAASNPPMRADIIEANREPIAAALGALASRLETLQGFVREGKSEELLALLEEAQVIRQRWGKCPASTTDPAK